MQIAYNELKKQGRAQRGYGSYRIVVVTDGDYNDGGNPKPLVEEIVKTSPVEVYVIGFYGRFKFFLRKNQF